jgi:hypothetical protein
MSDPFFKELELQIKEEGAALWACRSCQNFAEAFGVKVNAKLKEVKEKVDGLQEKVETHTKEKHSRTKKNWSLRGRRWKKWRDAWTIWRSSPRTVYWKN